MHIAIVLYRFGTMNFSLIDISVHLYNFFKKILFLYHVAVVSAVFVSSAVGCRLLHYLLLRPVFLLYNV